MPLARGQKVFGYEIEGRLGYGAFGAVYKAFDPRLNRHVAIKELSVAGQAGADDLKRFHQEARAAGNLNHPHIVVVHDLKIGKKTGTPYLIMEYLPGGSLRKRLEERGPLPVAEATRIAAEVCEGLAAAHEKGIIHRDIKPENVLMDEQGHAKIGDFGIAHVPSEMGGYGMTAQGLQPGTLPYMSPEQIRGEESDGRSDVYQVGLLLYEMLMGQACIDWHALTEQARRSGGKNEILVQSCLLELLNVAICEDQPKQVCELRPNVPGWVGEVPAKAIAKDVSDRPTARQLADVLREGENCRSNLIASSRQVGTEALAEEHLVRGIDCLRQGSLDQAVVELRAALCLKPGYIEAHLNLGGALARLGSWEEAICEFQAALSVNSACVGAHNSIGIIYEQQGRLDEALREYQSELEVNPDPAEARRNLERISRVASGTDFRIRRESFSTGEHRNGDSDHAVADNDDDDDDDGGGGGGGAPELLSAKEMELVEAALAWQAVLHIKPYDADAHFNLGVIYWQQGRPNDAIREYQAVLRIEPDNAQVYHALAAAFGRQGRLDDAICEYQTAQQLRPDDVQARVNLGIVYRQQGRVEDAIREFEAALHIKPDDANVHFNLGVMHAEQGRLDDAVCEYQAVLSVRPDWAAVHCSLGMIYAQQGHLEAAVGEYKAALRIRPGDAEVHFSLASIYEQQGRTSDAVHHYQEAVRIRPDWADAKLKLAHPHVEQGTVYSQRGRLDDAVREFQAALGLCPDYAEARLGLGMVYGWQNRLDDAVREFQAALDIKPNYAEAHRRLGIAYGRQGRYAEAHFSLGLAFLLQERLDDTVHQLQAALRIKPDWT